MFRVTHHLHNDNNKLTFNIHSQHGNEIRSEAVSKIALTLYRLMDCDIVTSGDKNISISLIEFGKKGGALLRIFSHSQQFSSVRATGMHFLVPLPQLTRLSLRHYW